MNRAPKIAALVAGMVAIVIGAAGVGAQSGGLAGDENCTHASGSARVGPVHGPGEDTLAELSAPADEIEVEQGAPPPPDAVDWSNPYDLMLHEIPPGKMRDMR